MCSVPNLDTDVRKSTGSMSKFDVLGISDNMENYYDKYVDAIIICFCQFMKMMNTQFEKEIQGCCFLSAWVHWACSSKYQWPSG